MGLDCGEWGVGRGGEGMGMGGRGEWRAERAKGTELSSCANVDESTHFRVPRDDDTRSSRTWSALALALTSTPRGRVILNGA